MECSPVLPFRERVDGERAAGEIARLRGAGDVELSTDEILALSRR